MHIDIDDERILNLTYKPKDNKYYLGNEEITYFNIDGILLYTEPKKDTKPYNNFFVLGERVFLGRKVFSSRNLRHILTLAVLEDLQNGRFLDY